MRKEPVPHFEYEKSLLEKGFSFVAGIDEVGRGAWAGPVVAAAVILPKRMYKLRDSKIIDRSEREDLARKIKKAAVGYGIGMASVAEIEEFGLHPATFLAYRRALEKIPAADYLLIDAYKWPDSPLPYLNIVKGDSISVSIAAASIIAKVERDMIMRKFHREVCAKYRFDLHKGYGTKTHQERLAKYGYSEFHRKNFKPIKKMLNSADFKQAQFTNS
jgi:ribonuclease HII